MSKWSTALTAHSPLSWLRLGDTSGSTAVAAAGSNGTYVNSPTLGVKGLLSADTDKAVTLARASSQRITVPDGASTDISDASFTLGCWVKAASQPTSGQFFTIAAKTNAVGSNESYSIDYRNESGTVRLACGVRTSGGFTTTKAVKTLSTGTTYFVVFVYDGTNMLLYVDGVELTKGAKTGNVSANNELLYWGAYNNVDHFDGTLDEVFLLPGALSAGQVEALFKAAAEAEGQQVTLGQASEADSARPLVFTKTIRKTLTPASESDSGQAVSKAKRVMVPTALEADGAQPVPRMKRLSLAFAAEMDVAAALAQQKRLMLGIASETDVAVALATVRPLVLGSANETDTAVGVAASKSLNPLPATEEDSAQSVSLLCRVGLASAGEMDAARPLAWTRFSVLAPATEQDQARELSYRNASGPINLLPAAETEQAVALDFEKPIHAAADAALESDAPLPLRSQKRLTLDPAVEADDPIGLRPVRRIGVLPGVETSTALPVQVFRHITLNPVAEVEQAQPLALLKPIHVLLQPPVEFDAALALLLGELGSGSFLVSSSVLPGVLVQASVEGLMQLALSSLQAVRLSSSVEEDTRLTVTQSVASTVEASSK